jgi:malonate transporter and related proteins
MLSTALGALLPIVVTMLLGFIAAWHHDFNEKQASTLNRMVLLYAVPMGLFAGTVSTRRDVLSQDIPLVIALCAAIIGPYVVVFLFSRFAFRATVSISALAALAVSAPAVPFIGPAVLGDLFGTASAVPIGIASLIINLTVIPVTILLLSLDAKQQSPQGETVSPNSENSKPGFAVLASMLFNTVKQPIVWAPVLAFTIVLAGIRIPSLLVHSFTLLGQAAGGVALFASGIILASGRMAISRSVVTLVALKNIVPPALVLVALRLLGYHNPTVSQAVLTTAIPMMPIVIMFAMQYRVAQAEAAAAVFLSSVSSVITMGAFIALTSQLT